MSEALGDKIVDSDRSQNHDDALGRIRGVIVQDLTKEERLLLLLWHAEAMTPSEIGLVLHTSASQIRTMHDRAIKRLRQLVCVNRATSFVC